MKESYVCFALSSQDVLNTNASRRKKRKLICFIEDKENQEKYIYRY